MNNNRTGFRNGQLIYPISYQPTPTAEDEQGTSPGGGGSQGGGGDAPSTANNDGVINTNKEVQDFLEGFPEGTKLKDTIGDTLTDNDILDTFGFKDGDVDLDND